MAEETEKQIIRGLLALRGQAEALIGTIDLTMGLIATLVERPEVAVPEDAPCPHPRGQREDITPAGASVPVYFCHACKQQVTEG